jgi:hypothetical protein
MRPTVSARRGVLPRDGTRPTKGRCMDVGVEPALFYGRCRTAKCFSVRWMEVRVLCKYWIVNAVRSIGIVEGCWTVQTLWGFRNPRNHGHNENTEGEERERGVQNDPVELDRGGWLDDIQRLPYRPSNDDALCSKRLSSVSVLFDGSPS